MHWVPLESNPGVFTQYCQALGANQSVEFCDVYGLDEVMLAMVQQPVHAICLLIPSAANKKMKEKLLDKTLTSCDKYPNDLWYTHQTVGNACGTVAMMHILSNVRPAVLSSDSKLGSFVARTKGKDPSEIASMMESSDELAAVHDAYAQQGATTPPEDPAAKVDEHFVALVPFDGKLVELDGAKTGPVIHCEVTGENFLSEAAKVCREYMEASEGSLMFAVTALVNS